LEADASSGKVLTAREFKGQLAHLLPTTAGDCAELGRSLVELPGTGKSARATQQVKLPRTVFALAFSPDESVDVALVEKGKTALSSARPTRLYLPASIAADSRPTSCPAVHFGQPTPSSRRSVRAAPGGLPQAPLAPLGTIPGQSLQSRFNEHAEVPVTAHGSQGRSSSTHRVPRTSPGSEFLPRKQPAP
jgi:hypothetical protein